MADPVQDEAPEARKKSRSPAYPSDSLETCIGWARTIYDTEKKSPTASVVAAKLIGYSSLSGPARVSLSALKKFGLVSDEGTERIRVSDDAVRLFFAPDEAQRLATVQMLAQKPEIIGELLRSYPEGLPSDESLNYKLVTEKDFGPDAAKTLIRVLRETVRFAKLEPGQYTPAQKMETTPPKERSAPASVHRAPSAPRSPQHAPASPRAPDGPLGPVPPALRSAYGFELSDGTRVDINTSAPLTADTFDEMMDYLSVYGRVLKKRAEAVRSEPTPQ